MTSAAKWKEFLRWWEEKQEQLFVLDRYSSERGLSLMIIDNKIKSLQDNERKK